MRNKSIFTNTITILYLFVKNFMPNFLFSFYVLSSINVYISLFSYKKLCNEKNGPKFLIKYRYFVEADFLTFPSYLFSGDFKESLFRTSILLEHSFSFHYALETISKLPNLHMITIIILCITCEYFLHFT